MTNPFEPIPERNPQYSQPPMPIAAPQRGFQRAFGLFGPNAVMLIVGSLSWLLFLVVPFALFFALGYTAETVVGLPQDSLNALMLGAAVLLALVLFSVMMLWVGVLHARAADILDGSNPRFSQMFSLRGALRPALVYFLRNVVIWIPLLIGSLLFLYLDRGGQEPSNVTLGVLAVFSLLYFVAVYVFAYLAMFAPAAATEVGVLEAFKRSFIITTSQFSDSAATAGIRILIGLVETVSQGLVAFISTPYLALAFVTKYRELKVQAGLQ